eukprot:7663859-Lingulodinium_polyedra.AAC.1
MGVDWRPVPRQGSFLARGRIGPQGGRGRCGAGGPRTGYKGVEIVRGRLQPLLPELARPTHLP